MPSDGHDAYRALITELAGLVRLAHDALRGATAVLTDPAGDTVGIPAAEKALAELRERIEEDAAGAVGGRAGVVAGVHVGTGAEALGQLAQRLLEAAWARQEREPFAPHLRTPLDGIAHAALGVVARAADALESGAPEDVADVLAGPPEVGQRQRLLYEVLVRSEDVDPVDAADLVLLSCCYQQCTDLAGAIARHAGLFARRGSRQAGEGGRLR
ncbi:hypothetical protein PUR71_27840 [Streptomyces sp. SP17BM10]|uniref:hypothetical protein n=1 Tax=Streptomyces sp. SP17BM10 TaxID=3002530 RepID=UPI002E7A33A3|nr:hypothetical protein [Streptomyces sp. SP17BM10]MEE1786684.1 hypothetical protein [Streptomyces sp. SP17BM10]